MVRNDYRLPTQLLLIVGFSLVTYIVVSVPMISYAVWPELLAAIVGVILIVKGLVSL